MLRMAIYEEGYIRGLFGYAMSFRAMPLLLLPLQGLLGSQCCLPNLMKFNKDWTQKSVSLELHGTEKPHMHTSLLIPG